MEEDRGIENSVGFEKGAEVPLEKYSNNLGVLYYDIWWNDEFLLALRTVQMTESEEATFLTSEQGFSLMHLIPRTREEIQLMERETKRRDASKRTFTYKDAKASEKIPRLPPGRFEDVYALMTTYSMMLELLFEDGNNHRKGLDAVRGQLMAM